MRTAISQYFKAVSSQMKINRDWRVGQTYFNVLLDFYPEIANEVRGGDLDPFHDDEQIEEFLAYVCERVLGQKGKPGLE